LVGYHFVQSVVRVVFQVSLFQEFCYCLKFFVFFISSWLETLIILLWGRHPFWRLMMIFTKSWHRRKLKIGVKNLKFCECIVESIGDWIIKLTIIICQYVFILLFLTHSFICQSLSGMLIVCHHLSFHLRVGGGSICTNLTLEWRLSYTVKRTNRFINIITDSSFRCEIDFSEWFVFFT